MENCRLFRSLLPLVQTIVSHTDRCRVSMRSETARITIKTEIWCSEAESTKQRLQSQKPSSTFAISCPIYIIRFESFDVQSNWKLNQTEWQEHHYTAIVCSVQLAAKFKFNCDLLLSTSGAAMTLRRFFFIATQLRLKLNWIEYICP